MRSVRLAGQALDGVTQVEIEATELALQRLRTAETGLTSMAEILSRAMVEQVSPTVLLGGSQTLGEEADRVLESLKPLASEHNVAILAEIEPEAAELSVGPLGAVLINGLRNAIESFAENDGTDRRIELSLSVDRAAGLLSIVITDTGPGLPDKSAHGRSGKPGGHGLGLGVCRDIIAELGGRLKLINVPFGRGAVLDVSVPIRRLSRT